MLTRDSATTCRTGVSRVTGMLSTARPFAHRLFGLPRKLHPAGQVLAKAAALEHMGAAEVTDTGGSSEAYTAQTLRELPLNYAPVTHYTVDNVAAADAERFQVHTSVEFWQNLATRLNTRAIQGAPEDPARSRARAAQLMDSMRDMVAMSALEDAQSAAYWAYHFGRTGFFIGTGIMGVVAHHLYSQLTGVATSSTSTPFNNLMKNADGELLNRVAESIAAFTWDLANIKGGAYHLPWDMTTLRHRQYNPLFVLNRSVNFIAEATANLNRRMSNGSTDNWFASNLYPNYYMGNTFHYQTDGWMSNRSADVYEFSTETLFLGRQDAMQRSALLPLHHYIQDNVLDPSRVRLLELGCGTGRFHTFLKDNYPSMPSVASDLSPFYLAEARDNMAYWKAQRAADKELGGWNNTGVEFMQCAAESIPAPDNSFDVVVSMYMTHEMPEEARVAMAREAARVLRPGGLFVLTDSVQLGDRPEWDPTLGAFGNFNEPHYRNYIACDFGALFQDAGFQPVSKYIASATKTLSFIKKAPPAQPLPEAAEGQAKEFQGNPSLN